MSAGQPPKKLTVPPRRILRVQHLIQQIDAAAVDEIARKVLAASTLAEISGLLGIPHGFPGYGPPASTLDTNAPGDLATSKQA